MKLLLVLAVSALASCLGLAAEGEETLRAVNRSGDALRAVVQIEQEEGGVPVFGEDILLAPGEARDYVVPMRAGAHVASITASNSIQDRIAFEIPGAGDSVVELVFTRTGVTLTTTSA